MWRRIRNCMNRFFPRKREFATLPQIFDQFQALLTSHQRAMELIADLGEKSGGGYIFDRKYLLDVMNELQDLLLHMIKGLNSIAADEYTELYGTLDRIFLPMEAELRGRLVLTGAPYVTGLTEAPQDNPELTGGKANTLAHIFHKLHIPVPNGFVVTNMAYHRFLEYNHLEDRIHSLLEAWSSGKETLSSVSGQIRYGILAGLIPQDLAREITRYAHGGAGNWAVRSSAYGEDGELSFAGLYESCLNVSPDQVQEAYKRTIASLYSPEALTYRQRMGMLSEEAVMAALCQEMINSRASGVIQTTSLDPVEQDCVVVYAAFGLGRTVVEGRDALDRYVIEKKPPYAERSRQIGNKKVLVRTANGGGEEQAMLPPEARKQPAISTETLHTLTKWALSLERYFKRPQEIEWAVDENGECRLLQCRRLVFPDTVPPKGAEVCESCSFYPVLVSGKGAVAHSGVGAGPVRTVHTQEEMNSFPEGAVLVTRYTAPWLAQVVPKAAAVITEHGSAAGHLSTIAREFRVPALVAVEGATEILRDGMDITLDTHNRVIYSGLVRELLHYELLQQTVFEESQEFRLLRRLLKRTAPLNLIDPLSPDFTPAACNSVHDMIRFIHEKAVQALMDLPDLLQRFKGVKVWKLVSDVPLGLRILDLGDGIAPGVTGDRVRIDQVESQPLRALWTGISLPDVWNTEPVDIDLRGLMSSLSRGLDVTGAGLSTTGLNLAVINPIYMNLHLRLGYHFNLIDARMQGTPQHNHIYFRFVGGVTDITRRSRRAQVLARILSHFHFNTIIKGDLVVARLLHLSKEEIRDRLQVLGALIGFTRQLDIQLRRDQDIQRFAEEFLSRQARPAQPCTQGGHDGWK